MENLKFEFFKKIDLEDPFFDSLKADYAEFADWFKRKSKSTESAYVLYNQSKIDGFLYLKFENEITDIEPAIYNKHILKIGTFKFNPQGTLRGQRFVKKILDIAIISGIELIYLTVFDKHQYLIKLFEFYGFEKHGTKTTNNGEEKVYVRNMREHKNHIYKDYPYINTNAHKYLLAIHPAYHTRLFPESKLFHESLDIILDVSHSNSIHKVYISKAKGANKLKRGDILVMYRTSDDQSSAYFRSVVSSVCIVESVRHISEFKSLDEYLDYCLKFSVFNKEELTKFYHQKYYEYVIRFTYNIALPKRLNRKTLLDNNIIEDHNRIVLYPLSDNQFNKIIELSNTNESFIIN